MGSQASSSTVNEARGLHVPLHKGAQHSHPVSACKRKERQEWATEEALAVESLWEGWRGRVEVTGAGKKSVCDGLREAVTSWSGCTLFCPAHKHLQGLKMELQLQALPVGTSSLSQARTPCGVGFPGCRPSCMG